MKTTKEVITTTEAHQLESELKQRVIKAIRKKIGKKKISLEDTGDLAFEDEAHNMVIAFDKDNIYFDGMMESYPLYEGGLLDLIYILGIVE